MVDETTITAKRLAVSVIGGAVVIGLVLFTLTRIYLPEPSDSVFGGPVEREGGPNYADQAREVFDCLRDREWRQSQFVEEHGEVGIPLTALWRFVEDEEVRYELWKHEQSPVGFERVRAARVDAERLAEAISESGNEFGAEIFPDRRYLFTVDRTTQSIMDSGTLISSDNGNIISSSGFLTGPRGATGNWDLVVNTKSGEVIGTIAGSDSWISVRSGFKDRSLTVFAELDQCTMQQRRARYRY